MIFVEMYKMLLNNLELGNVNYLQDIILCSGAFLCLLIDALITFVIISILIKIITKKNIVYWMNKIIKGLK